MLDGDAIFRLSTGIPDFDLSDLDEPRHHESGAGWDLRRHTFGPHRLLGHSWWRGVKGWTGASCCMLADGMNMNATLRLNETHRWSLICQKSWFTPRNSMTEEKLVYTSCGRSGSGTA